MVTSTSGAGRFITSVPSIPSSVAHCRTLTSGLCFCRDSSYEQTLTDGHRPRSLGRSTPAIGEGPERQPERTTLTSRKCSPPSYAKVQAAAKPHYSPMILIGTRFRRRPSRLPGQPECWPRKMRSQVPEVLVSKAKPSSRPVVTATTAARRGPSRETLRVAFGWGNSRRLLHWQSEQIAGPNVRGWLSSGYLFDTPMP